MIGFIICGVVIAAVLILWACGILDMEYGVTGPVLLIFASIALIILCAVLPVVRYSTNKEIIEYEVIKQTINQARQNGDSIENYAMQQKIIQTNQWVARIQFANKRFDIFIPDAVDSLEMLK